MATRYKVVRQSNTSTVVVDLDGGGATDIAVVKIFPGGPRTDESWAYSWDADGGDLLKRRDRPTKWKLVLRVPPQTTTANLVTKINSIRDAFFQPGNALEVRHEGESSSRYFNLHQTWIEPAITQPLDNVAFAVHKAVWTWDIEVWAHPYPQSSSSPAVY